jgi:enterobactin synthetase component D / holo-[acyl-carrier protein] synthase
MGRERAVRRSRSWRIGFAATEAPSGLDALTDEEQPLVAGASAARRAEFATGRHCARLAMASLSPALGRMPVLADARGAPVWPAGVVGSITHCPGWTGAVAARSSNGVPVLGRRVRSLGLDAEPAAPLPPGVLEVVASPDEREALERLAGLAGERPGIPWDTLLFAAKEATYKAWYPLTRTVVAHDAVHVELSASGTFSAVARADDAFGRVATHRVRGRWVVGPRVLVALGLVD